MTSFEKSSLIATWLQTIAVILGISIALYQLQQARQSLYQTEGKEIFSLLNRFSHDVENHYWLIRTFYEGVADSDQYRFADQQNKVLEHTTLKLNEESFGHSAVIVENYYESVNNCIKSKICEELSFLLRACSDMQAIHRQIKYANQTEKQKKLLKRYDPAQSLFREKINTLERAVCPTWVERT